MNFESIAAAATPPGYGAVGIVRVSGNGCHGILGKVFVPAGRGGIFLPGRFRFGRVVDPYDGKVVDEAIALVMKGPRSYTGEDSFELQCHGGPAAVSGVLAAVIAAGARAAGPGEFTRRAVLSGRLDLVQAEAVHGIVTARSAAARDASAANLGGALSRVVEDLRKKLLSTIVWFEAALDFPEDDIDHLGQEEMVAEISEVLRRVEDLVRSYDIGKPHIDGVTVAMVGKVNVGKSSLLNALTGRERSIVTSHPGTTRDIVEATLRFEALPVRLLDMAGLRPADDPIEREGIRRALAEARDADCLMVVLDSATEVDGMDSRILRRVAASGKAFVVVANKGDLPRRSDPERIKTATGRKPVFVSAVTGEGLDLLSREMSDAFASPPPKWDEGAVTSARQAGALRAAAGILSEILDLAVIGETLDIIATELRRAADTLSDVTGTMASPEVMGAIFSRFCIGK